MMVEQEILEAEKSTENNFYNNIKTSDLNSDNESINYSSKSERLLFNI